ncbi:hypothetical protein [Brevibacillus choshinensis]|uniref:Uncharacterized protein n=1 Tax=Brevibacillus choshinensis TaxID=54911 RepID=A0ABX7FLL1_BRECH|nr:hypothetical protein [Brevibacillus choshinensis]QRG66202.1 hypothetical protein JNE38_22005 [Brevibacillus choshinensis]
MTKKKLWSLGFFMILPSIILYWFYFSKPTSFPTNEQLVEEMNRNFPEATASVIQETIPVGERNVLVPFISKRGDYGLSYWVWKNHKWKVASIDTKGEPRLWKIHKNDPSSFYFVWNIHPKDQLSSIHFYMIRDRGYRITKGVEHYEPRVQMEKRVSLQEKSYGWMQLSHDWVAIMNAYRKAESAKLPEQDLFFGWIPYDQMNKETFPESSVNGTGYSNSEVDLEHVMIVNRGDIEFPR